MYYFYTNSNIWEDFQICISTTLTAKLFCYGVLPWSFNLIFSYLSNRIQHVKIKTSYSDKSNTEYGVPEGSILGPLLFNTDLNDLFFECDDSEIASYADNTTPYSCANDLPSIITQKQSTASKLFSWFTNNHTEVIPGKYLYSIKHKKCH